MHGPCCRPRFSQETGAVVNAMLDAKEEKQARPWAFNGPPHKVGFFSLPMPSADLKLKPTEIYKIPQPLICMHGLFRISAAQPTELLI